MLVLNVFTWENSQTKLNLALFGNFLYVLYPKYMHYSDVYIDFALRHFVNNQNDPIVGRCLLQVMTWFSAYMWEHLYTFPSSHALFVRPSHLTFSTPYVRHICSITPHPYTFDLLIKQKLCRIMHLKRKHIESYNNAKRQGKRPRRGSRQGDS